MSCSGTPQISLFSKCNTCFCSQLYGKSGLTIWVSESVNFYKNFSKKIVPLWQIISWEFCACLGDIVWMFQCLDYCCTREQLFKIQVGSLFIQYLHCKCLLGATVHCNGTLVYTFLWGILVNVTRNRNPIILTYQHWAESAQKWVSRDNSR